MFLTVKWAKVLNSITFELVSYGSMPTPHKKLYNLQKKNEGKKETKNKTSIDFPTFYKHLRDHSVEIYNVLMYFKHLQMGKKI